MERLSQHRLLLLLVAVAATLDTAATVTGRVPPLNEELTAAIHQMRRPALDVPMVLLTLLGTDPVFFGLVAIGAVIAARRNEERSAWLLIIATICARLLVVTVKLLTRVPRPDLGPPPWPLVADTDYSYPSGHALMSMFVFSATSRLFARLLQLSFGQRLALTVGASVLALGIGVSRVYLGFHWLNDVVAGYLYGATLFGAVLAVEHLFPSRSTPG